MHRAGKEKRDILVNRIAEAKTDQESAGRQLKTTLEAFQQLTGAEESSLQRSYTRLNSEFQKARGRSTSLNSRVDSIDRVGRDLFDEWRKELGDIRDPRLKESSRGLLRDAQLKHAGYLRAMRKTQAKIQPVLQAFQDQVIFLKHNLNAQAVASLKLTAEQVNAEINDLIVGIEGSKGQADQLISTLTASAS